VKIKDIEFKISKKEFLSKSIVSLKLRTKEKIDFKPGQFLMLKVSGHFLRRPFVIADQNKDEIKIIFKIKGNGTKKISTLSKNDTVNALLPLGNSFTIDSKKSAVLLGGGMGLVPLLPLLKSLKKASAITCAGASSKDELILKKEFKSLSKEVKFATDDGSFGSKCNSLELLKNIVKENGKDFIVYACGPDKMLENVTKYCTENNIECFLSLEERMGCGVGACLCCAIRTKNGIKRVCKDGPIFNAEELTWEKI
jgi:dihydroorotate dehydrogenase electron transfer subunit